MIFPNIESSLTCSCSECDSACCFEKRNIYIHDKCFFHSQKMKPRDSELKVKNIFNCSTSHINKELKEQLTKKSNNKIVSKTIKQGRILYKNVYHSNEKLNRTSKEHAYMRTVLNDPTITVNNNDEGSDDPAIKLAADVMNIEPDKVVPFVSCKQAQSNSKLEKHDLYNKIKEIYEACSCKVCECIVDSPSLPINQYSAVSNPCDCVESLKKCNEINSLGGCLCVRSNKKNSKGVHEKIENIFGPADNAPRDPLDYIDSLKLYDNSFLLGGSSYIKCDSTNDRDVIEKIENIVGPLLSIGEYIIDSSSLPSNKTISDVFNSIDSLKLCDKKISLNCPSIRHARKDCMRVVKNIEKFARPIVGTCECDPCKCISCIDNYTKPCQCKSCLCVECKSFVRGFSKQTTIVAPVLENLQPNVCQCSPCDCLNCTQNVEAMSRLSTREISTGMIDLTSCRCNPCSTDTCQLNTLNCSCEPHNRITRKPTDRNINEYDVRSAIIFKEKQFLKDKIDTIRTADHMHKFTSLYEFSNTYCDVGNCKCQNCECIVCKHNKCQNNVEIDNKENKLTGVIKNNNCKCSPCDCKICEKFRSEEDICSENFHRACRCKICDCISCCNLLFNEKSNFKQCINLFLRDCTKDDCQCEPCECTKCTDLKLSPFVLNKENNSNDILFENLYPVKKGKLLTPEMFEANERKTMQSKISINKNISLISDHDDVNNSNCSQAISNLNTKKSVSFKNIKHNKSSNAKIAKEISKYKNISKNKDQSVKNEILTNFMTQENIFNSKSVECDYQESAMDHKSSLNILYDNDLFQSNHSFFNKPTIGLTYTDSDSENNYIQRDSMKDSETMQRAKKLVKDADEYTAYLLGILEQSKKDNEDFIRVSEKFLSCEFHQESNDKLNETLTNVADKQTINELKNEVNYTNKKKVIDKYDKITEHNMKCFDYEIPTLSSMKNLSFSKITGKNELTQPLIEVITIDIKKNIPLKNKNIEKNNDEEKIVKYLDSGISAGTEVNIEENKRNEDMEICLSLKELSPLVNQTQADINNWETSPIQREIQNDVLEQTDVDKKLDYSDVFCQTVSPKIIIDKEVSCRSIEFSTLEQNNLNYNHISFQTDLPKLIVDKEVSCHSTVFAGNSKKFDYSHVFCQTNLPKIIIDKEVSCHSIKITEDIGNQVNDILKQMISTAINMSTFHAYMDDSIADSRIKNISEDKAKFIEIKTFSKNTALLRWTPPLKINKVQGYEVNGHAIQKFGPSRCMVVLTCLPHHSRVSITLRTITTPPRSKFQPSTEVIYYPRTITTINKQN